VLGWGPVTFLESKVRVTSEATDILVSKVEFCHVLVKLLPYR
jgi:hypothetical protein